MIIIDCETEINFVFHVKHIIGCCSWIMSDRADVFRRYGTRHRTLLAASESARGGWRNESLRIPLMPQSRRAPPTQGRGQNRKFNRRSGPWRTECVICHATRPWIVTFASLPVWPGKMSKNRQGTCTLPVFLLIFHRYGIITKLRA